MALGSPQGANSAIKTFAGGGNSDTISITTAAACIIVLEVVYRGSGVTPTTPTSDSGLVFVEKKHRIDSQFNTIYTYEAIAADALTAEVITVALSGVVTGGRMGVMGVAGGDMSDPDDGNASLPASNITSGGTSLGVTVSTNHAHVLEYIWIGIGMSGFTPPAGFTQVCDTGVNNAWYYKITPAALTNQVQTFSWSSGAHAGVMVAHAIKEASTGVLNLNDVTAGRVFQRNGSTADITVSGSYTGAAPAVVEAKVIAADGSIVIDWTLASAVIGGGTFTGTLREVPQGGGRDSTIGYRLQARSKDAGGNVLGESDGTNFWGVGDLWILWGSSTPARWFLDATTEVADVRLSQYDGIWAACAGAGAIALGNALLVNNPGIPIGLLSAGVPSTLLNTQWALQSYSGYIAMIAIINACGGKVAASAGHVGSNDPRTETIVSQAAHASKYRDALAHLRADIGQPNLPHFISGCARAPNEPSSSDLLWSWARAAEMDVAEDVNNYLGSTVLDLAMEPGLVHLSEGINGGNATTCRRIARAARTVFQGIGQYKGPKPVSVEYNPTTGIGRLGFQLPPGKELVGLISQSNLTGFIFKAAGVIKTPVTPPYISASNYVSFQLATGLSTVTAWGMTGTNPAISNEVFSNG